MVSAQVFSALLALGKFCSDTDFALYFGSARFFSAAALILSVISIISIRP